MNGRNFLELALLVPGVAPTNIASTQLFPETSAVPGISLSVGSQRNLSNNFVVDGLSANDDAAGLSGITYGVDAIEQFQVITSGAQAELGRALGGYINVVTKSGTNRLRGTVLRLLPRRRASTRANALSGTTLPMRQSQFGGSVGGPICRRIAPSTSPTSSNARSIRRAWRPSPTPMSPSSTRGSTAVGLRRPARSRPASIRTRSIPPTSSPRSITRSAAAIN